MPRPITTEASRVDTGTISHKSRVHNRAVDELLRLPNFKFTRERILGKEHIRAARALGAINKQNQLGKQAVITKRLTLIFECSTEVRKCYPTLKLETSFWETVVEDIKEHDATIARYLNSASLQRLVTAYASAYHRARGDGLASAASAIDLNITQRKTKSAADPRARLLASIECWHAVNEDSPYLRFTTKKDRGSPTTAGNAAQAVASVYPAQLDNETDKDYILRLQRTIVRMAENQRVSDDKNLEIRRGQSCVIQKRREEIVGLVAELEEKDEMLGNMADELDERKKEMEDLKLGGSESEPWVRWSTWAAQNGL